MARFLSEEFIKYCQENTLEKVKACLTLEVDVNTVSEDGLWSGLTIAAHKNYLELLDILLSHPAIKINQTTDAGGVPESFPGRQWTALMFACYGGNSDSVSKLTTVEGLDYNYQDHWADGSLGSTAAYIASRYGHTECVRVLSGTCKVDWNIGDETMHTPLYGALYYGHSDTVEILVEIPGIDFNVKTESGNTLAVVAVGKGVERSVDILANQKNFDCWNVPNKNGDTPVMLAFNTGKNDIFKILLECPRVKFDSELLYTSKE